MEMIEESISPIRREQVHPPTDTQSIMTVPDPLACQDLQDTVKFVVVPKDGEAHKYEAGKKKLAAASQVFDTIFQKLSSLKTEAVIIIVDFSPKAFKVMLRHVYERPYSLDNWKISLEVYGVAEKYQISSLQTVCEQTFASNMITSSNALDIYKLATSHKVGIVQSACEEVFERDSNIMLTPSFRRATEDVVRKITYNKTELEPKNALALINWGIHECRRRRISVNAVNVAECVHGVCGTRLSRRISGIIKKLSYLKRTLSNKHEWQDPLAHSKTVLIFLRDSPSVGTLMSTFNVDIICELKISVLKGVVEFTGVKPYLKQSDFEGENPLEVFCSTENLCEGSGCWDTKVVIAACEPRDIAFTRGLVVKPGQIANITARIEDLPISRCLQSATSKQVVTDKLNSVHFTILLGSNQASSSTYTGPFFIQKLYYRQVFGMADVKD